MINGLSLGGGVQSTALFLMSLHGEIENPCQWAIFADTGWERAGTYENIEYLTEYAKEFGVEVHTVSNGNLPKDTIDGERIKVSIPVFVRTTGDRKAMLRRQCTKDYKIVPIQKKIKELTGATYKNPTTQWIGISVDEAHRMKPSRVKYIQHRFPLVDMRIGRDGCDAWLRRNGFNVPCRSSCIGCPLHSNAEWLTLSDDELADVAAFERQLQELGMAYINEDEFYQDSTPYLHQSLINIGERPFDTKSKDQLNLFGDLEGETCDGN